MSQFHLAQLNIAKMREPLDSPMMADFTNSIDRINAIADTAPGFVWRLKDEAGDATKFRGFGDDVIINMSVWRDIQSLSNFSFRSPHMDLTRRRREWFERMVDAYAVLWWVPAGHFPTLEEAQERLMHLREFGVSPRGFSFKDTFPPPDAMSAAGATRAAQNDGACTAD